MMTNYSIFVSHFRAILGNVCISIDLLCVYVLTGEKKKVCMPP